MPSTRLGGAPSFSWPLSKMPSKSPNSWQLPSEKQLCNLDCIQRCTLLDLVTADEQVQATRVASADVSPHAPNIHIILITTQQS